MEKTAFGYSQRQFFLYNYNLHVSTQKTPIKINYIPSHTLFV